MPVPNQMVNINQHYYWNVFTVHLGAPDFSNDIYIWCSCERVNPLNTDSENIVVPNIANILLS